MNTAYATQLVFFDLSVANDCQQLKMMQNSHKNQSQMKNNNADKSVSFYKLANRRQMSKSQHPMCIKMAQNHNHTHKPLAPSRQKAMCRV